MTFSNPEIKTKNKDDSLSSLFFMMNQYLIVFLFSVLSLKQIKLIQQNRHEKSTKNLPGEPA